MVSLNRLFRSSACDLGNNIHLMMSILKRATGDAGVGMEFRNSDANYLLLYVVNHLGSSSWCSTKRAVGSQN